MVATRASQSPRPGSCGRPTNTDAHFAFTMYLVREHGKWTVAADNVHLVSS